MIDSGIEEQRCSQVPRLSRNAPGLFFVGRVHAAMTEVAKNGKQR